MPLTASQGSEPEIVIRRSQLSRPALSETVERAPTIAPPSSSSYSSYNAALAAQSLLEENSIDKWSPELARESFLVESGNMASALESLVSKVNETSDQLQKLNLHLQLATNETLLMSASLILDDRLDKLNDYFSRLSP